MCQIINSERQFQTFTEHIKADNENDNANDNNINNNNNSNNNNSNDR